MKSTTQIIEITTQKNEKYLSEERNLPACFCMLACLPRVCQLRNFPREFTEVFCRFWPIKLHSRFISHGIGCSYFSGDFLIIPFMVYMALKILVRSRGGGTFLCLASSVSGSAEAVT